ncbi:hypothetical protein IFM89_009237 [Coptis chinensis]|uniref:Uncharacterized protein n=1 Tax=Coptis chinensis TaxID=261450 RepID=A0A835MAG4_9MAGN|nr:hypothetical protein IFM89_009237 [Coptis chinensis]
MARAIMKFCLYVNFRLIFDFVLLAFCFVRHSGLFKNIPIVFPGSFHSYWLWHLKNNFATAVSIRNSLLKDIFKSLEDCATTPTHAEYQKFMVQLRNLGGEAIDKFLARVPYEHWAHAYFQGCRYGERCSTLAECFNSWIEVESFLPFKGLLNEILKRIMKFMDQRREWCKTWIMILCPNMEDIIAKKIQHARLLKVLRTSEYVYEVTEGDVSHNVDLHYMRCSCRYWELE